MSRLFFTVNCILLVLFMHITCYAANLFDTARDKTVVITSQTLTADNKNNTAVFEGSVVAKTENITMHSDKMTVFYNESENKIKKIHALGNVKVHSKDSAIFSDEAVYLDSEEKIIFSGNPKAVEGENVITGAQITFYFKENRAVVEESRVILQNKQGIK